MYSLKECRKYNASGTAYDDLLIAIAGCFDGVRVKSKYKAAMIRRQVITEVMCCSGPDEPGPRRH